MASLASQSSSSSPPALYSKGALASALATTSDTASKRKRKRKPSHSTAATDDPASSSSSDALAKAFAHEPTSRTTPSIAGGPSSTVIDPPHNSNSADVSSNEAKTSNNESQKNSQVDEAEKLNRTVFIGNVPILCNEKALKRFLRESLGVGCVESVRFRSVAVAGTKVSEANNYKLYRKASAIQQKYNPERDSKNAYVVFKNDDFAEDALDLNGSLFQERHLRIDRADGASSRKKHDHKKSVFLGNLPFNVDEEQIHSFFANGVSGGEKCIKGVRVVRDRGNNMGIGIGYVLFEDADYVTEAVALNGTKFQNREIRVRRCRKNASEKSNRGAKRRASQNNNAKKKQKIKGKSQGGRAGGRRTNWQGSKARPKDGSEVRKGLNNKRRKLKRNANKHSHGGKGKRPRKPRSSTGRNAKK